MGSLALLVESWFVWCGVEWVFIVCARESWGGVVWGGRGGPRWEMEFYDAATGEGYKLYPMEITDLTRRNIR